MRNRLDESTVVIESANDRLDETQELKVTEADQIAALLVQEHERSGSALGVVFVQYYKEGKVTEVGRGILFDILKKHPDKVMITSDLVQKLPEAIEIAMARSGYDPDLLRKRIRDLQSK